MLMEQVFFLAVCEKTKGKEDRLQEQYLAFNPTTKVGKKFSSAVNTLFSDKREARSGAISES